MREKDGGGRKFTNVYIKNIGCEMSEENLRSMCEKFGEITSIYVPLADEVSKKPKGFGFVAFKSPESAAEVHRYLLQSSLMRILLMCAVCGEAEWQQVGARRR